MDPTWSFYSYMGLMMCGMQISRRLTVVNGPSGFGASQDLCGIITLLRKKIMESGVEG